MQKGMETSGNERKAALLAGWLAGWLAVFTLE
jgi:hypothetical protein